MPTWNCWYDDYDNKNKHSSGNHYGNRTIDDYDQQ